jgi:hypothetical protein
MTREPIPDDVRRFILTGVPSVPYLEAMLLLRNEPERTWDANQVSRRLYMGEKEASAILERLAASGIAAQVGGQPATWQYGPRDEALGDIISRLADVYSKQLVEVTHLIHSTVDQSAQQFSDAFRLRKEP